jgi:L-aspartate oxidase
MEVSRAKDPFIYLDMTPMNSARVQKRFPRVHATLMKHNIDLTEDMIPVRPAANFAIGGARTDLDGKTNLAGLYAAGEIAATGVHGANRLPSNALLEGLVCGARAGKAMREELKHTGKPPARKQKAITQSSPVDPGMEEVIGRVQDLMWKSAGIVRTRTGMVEAIKVLEGIAPRAAHPKTRRGYETANLHLVATLVARSALAREESRGSHYRIDCPTKDDKKFLKHSLIQGDRVRFV